MEPTEERLISYRVLRNQTDEWGPIPDFLAKKEAEQASRTVAWYRKSLLGYWAFVEPLGLTAVGQFGERAVKPHFDLIPDDLRGQLFALYSPRTFLGSRNLAMLAVLSDTGLRREKETVYKLRWGINRLLTSFPSGYG